MGVFKKVKTKEKNWVYKDLSQLSNLIKYLKKKSVPEFIKYKNEKKHAFKEQYL